MSTTEKISHMPRRSVRILRARTLQLAVAALSFHAASSASAVTKTWVGADGNFWNNINAWSPTNAPVNGDTVIMGTQPAGTGSVTALFTSTYSGVGLTSLKIDSTGITGLFTLSQSLTGSAMIATTEIIGDTIGGNLYTQNGGSNTATTITLGNGASGGGCYSLLGAANVSATNFNVGLAGNGLLTQSAGFIGATNLTLANSIGSNGTYNLSGTGSLSTNTAEIGLNGNATVNQTGGCVGVSGTMTIAILSTSTSTYNLSGGSIGFIGSSASLNVGQLGVGTFNQTGGTFNYGGGSLFLATGFSGATGNYTLANSAVISNAGDESIGFAGKGNFFQTGGNNTISKFLTVGDGGPGCYTLSATTGPGILAAGNLTIGSVGVGTFTQNGGCCTINGTISVADEPSSSGSAMIINGGNFISSADDLTISIGNGGNGTYSQTGGCFTSDNFFLGDFTLTTISTFSLSNGNFSAGNMIIGRNAIGSALQTGGNATLGVLTLGQNVGTSGTYSLTNGNISAGSEYIASSSTAGNLFTQLGGLNAVNSLLSIGLFAGSVGKYQLNGGNLTVGSGTTIGVINVGDVGSGSFVQTGGNVTLAAPFASLTSLVLANDLTNGSYSISNGNLIVGTFNGALIIGNKGGGSFTQTGGAVTVNGSSLIGAGITIGNLAGSQGNYNMSAGSLVAGSIVINSGSFSLSGGTANFGANSHVASGASVFLSATGILNLNASTSQFLILPSGTFSQTGGTLNGFLTNNGNVNQFSGTFNAYLTNAGTFTYTAGIFNGTYEHDFTGKIIWPGAFLAAGGILNKGTLTIPTNYSLSVGTLGIDAFDNESIILLTGGATTGTGPLINNGSISGNGFISGFGGLMNNSVLSFNNGILLLNNLGANSNPGTILGSPGNTLQIDSNLTNIGTINLGGGTLNGAGTLTNAAGGTISGFGILSIATFNNAGGTLQPQGGTLHLVNAITNTGIIQLTPGATLSGPNINNSSTIQGEGTISNIIINNGSIEPVGGSLILSAPLTNTAAGTISIATSNKLLLLAGLATNVGTINLAGGIFDNSTNSLNNTGSILGYGTFRTGGAGLTNSGSILFAGGSTTINGPVTNTATHTLEVRNTPAIFTSPVTNNANATFKTTTTTATFAASFTNNGTYTSDPATNVFQGGLNSSGLMTGGIGDVYNFVTGTVINSGTFSNGGTLISADNITNSGTFTQTGPQTWSTGTTFTNTTGTATFGTDTGTTTSSPLSILNNSGSINLNSDEHLNSLNIQNGNVTISTGVTKTNALTFGGSTNNWTGTLDLTSAKLIVEDTANHAATLALVKNEVGFGHTHAAGITSSAIPSNKVLVVSDNAIAHLTNFGGINNVDAGSILETVAYKGDFNLDGVVDIQDLTTVANHWQQAASDWSQGDFDGNSIVDIQDLTAVANNWQAGVGAGGGQSFNDALAQIGGFGTTTSTPEPASLALLTLGAAILPRRRRPIFS